MENAPADRVEDVSLDEFITRSAEMSYLLMSGGDLRALINLLFGTIPPRHFEEILIKVIEALLLGYGDRTRRIGTPMFLHPLRVAWLLVRYGGSTGLVEVLCSLLHDRDEDITPDVLDGPAWERFSQANSSLFESIDQDSRWLLGERISILTRHPESQTYHQYIGSILDRCDVMPDLLWVKLADRLDNSLDVSTSRPVILRCDFYRASFEILLVPGFKGVEVEEYHALPPPEEGIKIISQLFKNAITLSIIAQEGRATLDRTTSRLFGAIAGASIRLAQWLALEVFASEPDVNKLGSLLLDTRSYVMGGGLAIRRGGGSNPMDGLFLRYEVEPEARAANMLAIYEDREMLARVALVFLVLFSAFSNDQTFFIPGIDRHRARPVD